MKKSINTRIIAKYLTRWGIDTDNEVWGLIDGTIKFENNEYNQNIFYKLDLEFKNGVVMTKIKIIQQYTDSVLNKNMNAGEIIEVTDERADLLISKFYAVASEPKIVKANAKRPRKTSK